MIALLSRLLTGPAPLRAPWHARLVHWLGLCARCEHGQIWLPFSWNAYHHAPRRLFGRR